MGFRQQQIGQCLIVGHRGAAGLLPENTLPSFALAVAHGVDAVELDVHWAHQTLWVIHDATLDRTTNGTGPLTDCPVDTLRALDAGAGARVPVLEDVLREVPEAVGINIELKGKGTATPVAHLLRQHPTRDVLVSSFDHTELAQFHGLSPAVPVAPLFSRWRADAWETAARLDAWSINVASRLASRRRIAAAHARGLRMLVYTVNDRRAATRLIAAGVDGLFTDYPDGRLGTPGAPP